MRYLLDFSLIPQLSTDTDVCGSLIWDKDVPYQTVAYIPTTYTKSLRNIRLKLLALNTVRAIGSRLYYVVHIQKLYLKHSYFTCVTTPSASTFALMLTSLSSPNILLLSDSSVHMRVTHPDNVPS